MRIRWLAPLALLIWIASFFGHEIWRSSQISHSTIQYQRATTDHQRTQKDTVKEGEKAEEALARYTYWLMIFTGVLAFATVALGVATLGLYFAGERQLRLAREEFLSTHRPKIRIKHLLIRNDIWQGEPIIVDLWVINAGTADATLNTFGIRCHVVKNDRALPIKPYIESFPLGGRPAPIGLNLEFPNIDIGRRLTPEENVEIQQGRSRLYCVGFVSYLDRADRRRITGFCRVLTFPPNTTARIDNTRFRRFDDPDYDYED